MPTAYIIKSDNKGIGSFDYFYKNEKDYLYGKIILESFGDKLKSIKISYKIIK